MHEVTRRTVFSRTTLSRLKQCLDTEHTTRLDHLFSQSIQTGSKHVVNDEEANVINERLKIVAERGFAVDAHNCKHVLSRVASDGPEGWKNKLTSDETVRTYRARYKDIAYKKVENKEAAKLAAECFRHVDTFFLLLDVWKPFIRAY